jgi:hypothetical protein
LSIFFSPGFQFQANLSIVHRYACGRNFLKAGFKRQVSIG